MIFVFLTYLNFLSPWSLNNNSLYYHQKAKKLKDSGSCSKWRHHENVLVRFTAIVTDSSHLYSRSSPKFILCFIQFLSRVDELNKLASLQCVGLQAQLGEHCSANAEATGSNPVEAPKKFFHFFGLFRNCLNCDLLRCPHIHFICIPAVHIISFCIRIVPFFRTGAP